MKKVIILILMISITITSIGINIITNKIIDKQIKIIKKKDKIIMNQAGELIRLYEIDDRCWQFYYSGE